MQDKVQHAAHYHDRRKTVEMGSTAILKLAFFIFIWVKNIQSKHLTLFYPQSSFCLIIFITSRGCFWLHPSVKWNYCKLSKWDICSMGTVLFFFFLFCQRLEQNQFGGVSKQWGRWKGNSTFDLEIRHEQCPRLDRSGDYVFDHNANSTLSQGGGEGLPYFLSCSPNTPQPPPQSPVHSAWDRFKRSSFKDETLIWELRLEGNK